MQRFMAGGDFFEGVRALLIDKDSVRVGRQTGWKRSARQWSTPISLRSERELELSDWKEQAIGADRIHWPRQYGGPMVANLLKAGHSLTVFDIAQTTWLTRSRSAPMLHATQLPCSMAQSCHNHAALRTRGRWRLFRSRWTDRCRRERYRAGRLFNY